tara:strand:- start:5722 stop:7077 length:1356 start_codon:yes stop_codon:yes gene_type:complete
MIRHYIKKNLSKWYPESSAHEVKTIILSLWLSKLFLTLHELSYKENKDQLLSYAIIKLEQNPFFFCNYSLSETINILNKKNSKKDNTLLSSMKLFIKNIYNILLIYLSTFAKKKNKIISTRSGIDILNVTDKQKDHYIGSFILQDMKIEKYKKKNNKNINFFLNIIDDLLVDNSYVKYKKSLEYIKSNADKICPNLFDLSLKSNSKYNLFRNVDYEYYEIINHGYDLFKNSKILYFLFNQFNGIISGAQHGGAYGTYDVDNVTMEIECYEKFYYMKVGKNDNNKDKTKRFWSKQIGFKNEKGIVLIGSNNPDKLHSSTNSKNNIFIKRNSDIIKEQLKKSNYNLWIKEHPKYTDKKDYYNCDINTVDYSLKPVIDKTSVTLVIFDTPAQTLEIFCMQNDIKYIYAFDSDWFPLTEHAIKIYQNKEINDEVFYGTKFINKLDIYMKNKKYYE